MTGLLVCRGIVEGAGGGLHGAGGLCACGRIVDLAAGEFTLDGREFFKFAGDARLFGGDGTGFLHSAGDLRHSLRGCGGCGDRRS